VSAAGSAPGVFGKLPARADFITRGLSHSFTEPWHAWLVGGLRSAAEALGARFEPSYMAAPVWRFILPPGLCGPEAAAGVLLPSVDSVGRRFPLTLAAVSASVRAPLALMAAPAWFDSLEEAGREALARDPDLDAWTGHIAALVPVLPPVLPPCQAVHVTLAQDDVVAAIRPALATHGADHAVLFWCEGSPYVRPCALVMTELPIGAWFARLFSDPVLSGEDAS
jgi:type VI secretion system protein ImpM